VLAAWLLTGLFTAPLASAAMFLPVRLMGAAHGTWPTLRRFAAALVATTLLAAIAFGLSIAVGTTTHRALVSAALFTAFSLLLLPVTRRWNGRAHVCWTACSFLYVAYLIFIIDWTFHSGLGVGGTIGGVVLWSLEVIAGLFAGAYLWELCDVLGTEDWRRRVVDPRPLTAQPGHLPFVSLHVPAHNEPPDMVIATLTTLLEQDYPNYEIIVIDDNTDDQHLWQPVEQWCKAKDVKFIHLADWPGYKSGALNYALQHMIDPRTELIGVVDSDYQIDSAFLRECAPLFADPRVGFIQAPQDYRDWEQAPYYRRLYYSYKYFFAVSQPSRNEHDAAIFAGTMGLIRRDALEGLGGWDEWCITEDAELSLRLMRAGWSGLHVDKSFGRGVMPLTFEALKSQRYRWCFGGIQILRMYWRSLLPGRRTADNNLTAGQRWGYLAGGIQWYGDLLGVTFYLFLLAGAVNLALGGGQLFRKLTGFLVAAVPVLVVLGLIRAVALLRRGTGATWGEALGSFFIWQATSLVVARASVQGVFAKKAAFLRTPKTFDESGIWQVIRANWAETGLALLGAGGIIVGLTNFTTLSGPLLAALLLAPTAGYAAAPYNSFAAQRAALPADLRSRRRTEFLRSPAVAGTAIAGGGVAVAVGAIAVVALLLTPDKSVVHAPSLIAGGHTASHNGAPARQRRNASPTPTAASSTSAPSSGSPSITTPTSSAPSSSSTPTSTSAPHSSSAPSTTARPSSPSATSTVPSPTSTSSG
jgi:glycosyltransferase involved in cell wall biosynthesis